MGVAGEVSGTCWEMVEGEDEVAGRKGGQGRVQEGGASSTRSGGTG